MTSGSPSGPSRGSAAAAGDRRDPAALRDRAAGRDREDSVDRAAAPAPALGSGPVRGRLWLVAAFTLVVVVTVALRLALGAGSLGMRYDEQWILPPIVALIEEGWSVRTAIDFEETKGPGFIWPYALLGGAFGAAGDVALGRLRLVSALWFIVGAVPLFWIARRSGIAGPALLGVAAFYVLLPQSAILGQLVMSEPLFVTGALALMALFLWSFAEDADGAAPVRRSTFRRTIGPILCCLVLAGLLHARIHAVAFAAAICAVAWLRDGPRSWPWLLAALLAGLSRIPLALRWGGLVSPMYREMHQIAEASPLAGLANAAYLLAALVPWTGLFLLRRWSAAGLRDRRWLPLAGAGLGALAAVIASPAFASKLPAPPLWAERAPEGIVRYLGAAASVVRSISSAPTLQAVLYVLLAAIGGASLAALLALATARRRPALGRVARGGAYGSAVSPTRASLIDDRTIGQLAGFTLCFGVALYIATQSFVLDRYLLPWSCLLPILWWRWLPPGVRALQFALMLAAFAWSVRAWLSP
ncbi:MAG TPA: hypothetical protein PKC43_04215 [Phycisphaerales bacterium]|nr:hypothetical protein [Phycisphaerales bacterium]HMP36632.1 hypothetical protein [Phycisphaerales bacterium]